jgi:hypothetical protein
MNEAQVGITTGSNMVTHMVAAFGITRLEHAVFLTLLIVQILWIEGLPLIPDYCERVHVTDTTLWVSINSRLRYLCTLTSTDRVIVHHV